DELGSGRTAAPGVVFSSLRRDTVFARQVLPEVAELEGGSVRALAEAAYGAVERAVDAWPGPFALHAMTAADIHPDVEPEPRPPGRARLIERGFAALLAERRRRASRRRAVPAGVADFDGRWLLVQLLALARGRLLASAASPRALAHGGVDLAPWPAGAAPVEVDRPPPSRAYHKLHEPFACTARAPPP